MAASSFSSPLPDALYALPPPAAPSPPPATLRPLTAPIRDTDTILTLSLAPPPPPIDDAMLSFAPPPPKPPSPKSALPPRRFLRAARPAPMPIGPPPPCTECGKQFDTAKALYGHMRCHPGRPWRGVTPPEQFPAAAIGAGNNLALMSSDNKPANNTAKRSTLGSPKAVCKSPPPPPPPSTFHDTLTLSLAHPASPSPKMLSAPPRRFARAARPAPTPDGPPPPCIECGKQFATAKALHGHMRTHPERPYRGITKPGHDDAAFLEQFAAKEFEAADTLLLMSFGAPIGSTTKIAKRSALDSPVARGDAAVHKCGVCGMVFANGWALGGHKRLHWEGAAAAAAASLELSLAPPGQ